MANELTWRQAINQILGSSTTPLHYMEITERIISEGLRSNLGATPAKTVNAHIASSLKHDGISSPFVKVAKGTFALKDQAAAGSSSILAVNLSNSSEPEDIEEQYEIITSFGMFWRREAIEWTSTPKLLGVAQGSNTPVNFCKQIGVYLLYDGREVIYVGRTTEKTLGKRLYDHTLNRLSTRWDRFSWFGLLPISEIGEIGSLPAAYEAKNIIPALEAILIEALEPRQNRKRGDDLNAVEFSQVPDPQIEKKKITMAVQAALNKACES
jgi:hypothetical protein